MRGTLFCSQSTRVVGIDAGEIYPRLKPYLVVKISSDIVTEHCCQVFVLSMMFCRSTRLCANMVSDCAISRKLLGVPTWFDLTAAGQRGIQNIFFTFHFHILH